MEVVLLSSFCESLVAELEYGPYFVRFPCLSDCFGMKNEKKRGRRIVVSNKFCNFAALLHSGSAIDATDGGLAICF